MWIYMVILVHTLSTMRQSFLLNNIWHYSSNFDQVSYQQDSYYQDTYHYGPYHDSYYQIPYPPSTTSYSDKPLIKSKASFFQTHYLFLLLIIFYLSREESQNSIQTTYPN